MKHLRSTLLVTACFSIFSTSLFALPSGTIIQVMRKLRMTLTEAVPPKEFIIDIGTRQNVREGDVLEVSRLVPILSPLSITPWELMKVVLGEIRVFQLGEVSSIGRVLSQKDSKDLPVMDYLDFMIGDQVELKTNLPSATNNP